MRILSVSMLVLFALACRASEVQRSDPRLSRLLADREAIWQAWFTNDQPRLEALLPSDVVAINSGDSTWQGRAAVIQAAKAFAQGGQKFVRVTFPRTEQQVFGDVAILYSRYEVEIQQQNGRHSVLAGRATEVFVWRDSLWQNSGWHLDAEH